MSVCEQSSEAATEKAFHGTERVKARWTCRPDMTN